MYEYDSPQQAGKFYSEEELKIFSARRSFSQKKWDQCEIRHHRGIFRIWHFERKRQTKQIVADY